MSEQAWDKLLRVTKLFISVGFFLYSKVKNAFRSLLGRKPSGTCVAIHYHEVTPQHRTRFARQMDILLHYASPIACDHKEPLQPGQHYAVVTFDDGFVSALENAVPELVQRRIPATFFVTVGLLGTLPRWAGFESVAIREELIATAEDLRELPCDLITIGSHTMTHPVLTSLSEDEAKIEISASRAKLEKLLNRDIKLFSFPYGAFNERLIELCHEVGYERVFTVRPKLAFTDPHEFVTGRIAVNPTDWELEFRLKILGAYQWLPKAIAWKQKILGRQFHDCPRSSETKKGSRSALYGIN